MQKRSVSLICGTEIAINSIVSGFYEYLSILRYLPEFHPSYRLALLLLLEKNGISLPLLKRCL